MEPCEYFFHSSVTYGSLTHSHMHKLLLVLAGYASPRARGGRRRATASPTSAADARGTLIELRSTSLVKSKTGSASASFELSSYDGSAASAPTA